MEVTVNDVSRPVKFFLITADYSPCDSLYGFSKKVNIDFMKFSFNVSSLSLCIVNFIQDISRLFADEKS